MGVPRYTFTLRSDGRDNNDEVGIALTDNASVYRYACTVARELMRCRETQTRYWKIKVYRDGEAPSSMFCSQPSTRRLITFAVSCAPW